MTLIKDLEQEVLLRCENRTTDTARVDIWIRDAILDISSDPEFRNEFDELEVSGPLFKLSGSKTIALTVQEYPFSNLLPSGDYNLATLDIVLWTDYPTNNINIRLNTTSYQKADQGTNYPGQPVEWYRFGDICGFQPPPDKNYQVQARYYRMHPILDATLNMTPILLPRNWHEVIVMAAVEKGFQELMQFEKASAVHTLLHGDPKYPLRLGMINGKKKRREKENFRTQSTLQPRYRGYGWGSNR